MRCAFAITLFTAVAGIGNCVLAGDAMPPTHSVERVETAIRRATPYIEREGQAWIDTKKCVTCHQIPFMTWSLNAAAKRGLYDKTDQLQAWNDWANDWNRFSAADKPVALSDALKANTDTLNALLLSGYSGSPTAGDEPRSTFVQSLMLNQEEDGSWLARGQLPLQKRPARETQEVTTMWTLLATRPDPMQPEWRSQSDKARTWLAAGTPGDSTEWWAAKLLLAIADNDRDAVGAAQNELLARQHDDGGFGWLSAEPSDALGTGQALYALASAPGSLEQQEAIGEAVEFLTGAQTEDGSWPTPGTKKASKNRITPTASYWGTCWAVIGLAQTLPGN